MGVPVKSIRAISPLKLEARTTFRHFATRSWSRPSRLPWIVRVSVKRAVGKSMGLNIAGLLVLGFIYSPEFPEQPVVDSSEDTRHGEVWAADTLETNRCVSVWDLGCRKWNAVGRRQEPSILCSPPLSFFLDFLYSVFNVIFISFLPRSLDNSTFSDPFILNQGEVR